MNDVDKCHATADISDDVDLLLSIDDQISASKGNLSELEKRREEVASRLAEQWAMIGKQSESRRGKTIYRSRDLFVNTKAGMGGELTEACKAEGLGDLVREGVNVQSLKSWVREHAPVNEETGERDFSQVPEAILEVVNCYESYGIKVRKS